MSRPPSSLAALAALTRVYFVQAMRSRVLSVAWVVAGCVLGLAALASQGTVQGRSRIVADFSLAGMHLACCGVVVAATVGGLAGDRAHRLDYTWLARPIARHVPLLGRALALWAVLAVLVATIAAAGAATVQLFGGAVPPGYVAAAAMTWVELIVLQACTLLLATLCAPPLAAAGATVVLAAGHFAPDLAGRPGGGNAVVARLLQLLPDFAHLSLRPYAAAGQAPPIALIVHACGYGLGYAAVALLLAAAAYARRRAL